jgi:CBS domain-containing protein
MITLARLLDQKERRICSVHPAAPVVTLGPDASVEDAMRVMTEKRIRHLPVMQGDRVLGLVSIGDLVKSVIDDQRHLIEDLTRYIARG